MPNGKRGVLADGRAGGMWVKTVFSRAMNADSPASKQLRDDHRLLEEYPTGLTDVGQPWQSEPPQKKFAFREGV